MQRVEASGIPIIDPTKAQEIVSDRCLFNEHLKKIPFNFGMEEFIQKIEYGYSWTNQRFGMQIVFWYQSIV